MTRPSRRVIGSADRFDQSRLTDDLHAKDTTGGRDREHEGIADAWHDAGSRLANARSEAANVPHPALGSEIMTA
jgi:hypothetical protein